jgi:N-acetylglutamate synthase-like GNAT family acetyltransferase
VLARLEVGERRVAATPRVSLIEDSTRPPRTLPDLAGSAPAFTVSIGRVAPRWEESVMVAIRTARSGDAQAIVSLMDQLGYRISMEDVVERLQRRGRVRQVFVATRDGRVLGWAAVSIEESFVTGRGALIQGFVVDENARNERIGAELLRSVERWARERGSAKIRVLSNVVRERAHRFYERYGYEKIKAQYNLHKAL